MSAARVLEHAEWSRLSPDAGLGLLKSIRPEHGQVVTVEEGGDIAACVAVLRLGHFEGLWIKPEARGNAGIFRRLIRKAFGLMAGDTWVIATAKDGDEAMESLLTRLGGVRVPVSTWMLPVRSY